MQTRDDLHKKEERKERLELWYKWIISVVGIIVALCAFVISIQQLRLSREVANAQLEQNRLSVKPLLSFHSVLSHYEDENGIRLHNDGLGVAFIDSMQLFYKCDSLLSWADLQNKIIEDDLFFAPIGTPINKHSPNKDGGYLKEGSNIWIISLPYEKITDYDKYAEYISNIGVKVFYKSIYEEKDTIGFKNNCQEK